MLSLAYLPESLALLLRSILARVDGSRNNERSFMGGAGQLSAPAGVGADSVAVGSPDRLTDAQDRARAHVAGERSTAYGVELSACAGRKPAGLVSQSKDRGASKLGDYLAHCAHLEAASVIAFERLACELNTHGAPLELIDEAITARGDEVRHALVLGQLARLHGGEPVAPTVAGLTPRALPWIAIENAVEGCVRETYGALVAGYQSEHAQDPRLRATMAEIAEDEARHAAFAHRVQRWIMPRLRESERERVRHAQQRGVFDLAGEAARSVEPELRLMAGLPSPAMGRVLVDELSRALWNPHGNRPRRAALG